MEVGGAAMHTAHSTSTCLFLSAGTVSCPHWDLQPAHFDSVEYLF